MELETKLKRFKSDASEEFSVHTIPSNRSSIKNVQTAKISRKRFCGIIMNLFLGTAIIVDLFWWHFDYNRIETESKNWPKSINTSWTLSNAINEVNENLFSLINSMEVKKNENYFDAVISPSAEENEIKICPHNYILSKENC